MAAEGAVAAPDNTYFPNLDRKCAAPASSFAVLLINGSLCVMTLARSCVYKLHNAALHSCTTAVHSVCRVFGLVCLQ